MLLSGVALVLVVLRLRWRAPDLLMPAVLFGGALILASLIAVFARIRYGEGGGMTMFAGGLVTVYIVVAVAVLPAVDRHKSARPFAERIADRVDAAALGIYPHYHAAFSYYTGKTLDVLTDKADLDRFLTSAPSVFAIVEERHYMPRSSDLPISPAIVDRATVGHRSYLLVEGGDQFGQPDSVVPPP